MPLEITNDDGTFRYAVREKRWLCVKNHRPSGDISPNCYVPIGMEAGLTLQARAEGATPQDFGIRPKREKAVRVKGTGTRKSRAKVEGVILFDFGE